MSLKINTRTETTFGVASVGLSVMSLAMFIYSVYQSAYHLEGREVIIGSIELIAILFALVGLLFGLIGETREDKLKLTSHIGIVTNILVGIFHVIVLMHAY